MNSFFGGLFEVYLINYVFFTPKMKARNAGNILVRKLLHCLFLFQLFLGAHDCFLMTDNCRKEQRDVDAVSLTSFFLQHHYVRSDLPFFAKTLFYSFLIHNV